MFRIPARILFILFVFSIVFLFYTPGDASAYFIEEFNNGYSNPDVWEVNNSGGISFSNSEISLSHFDPYKFPYVRSIVPIVTPQDDLIKLRFRYTNSGGNFGNGIAITDFAPPLNTIMSYPAAFSQYTIFYIWHSPGNPYFHIVTFLCEQDDLSCIEGTPRVIHQSTSADLNYHDVSIYMSDNSYEFLLDGSSIFTSRPSLRQALNIWYGHPQTTGTSGQWASFVIDYIEVGHPPPVATFPYFSQKDPLWASEEYDSATRWADIGKYGIDRWGCTPTSVAMILDHYDVNMPDGSAPNPSRVNSWLKSQPDGYIGPGLLNWIAITRLARDSYKAGHSSTKLEYSRSKSAASVTYPSILGLPGHFLVAHAEDGDDWLINDPNDALRTELSKSSSLVSVNRFTPSLTDLSYMMFVSSGDQDMSLTDENGNPISLDWSEEYLQDAVEGHPGSSIKTALVAKPSTGKYILTVKDQDSQQEIDGYFYDDKGNVSEQKFVVPAGLEADFEINYASVSGITTEVGLDHSEFISFLESQRVKKTKTYAVYRSIINQFNRLVKKDKPFKSLIRYIERRTPKIITVENKEYILSYLSLVDANRP